MKWIAKYGGWFKPGTECFLVADCEDAGVIMSGIRISEVFEAECVPVGQEYEDEELCPRNEFDVTEA